MSLDECERCFELLAMVAMKSDNFAYDLPNEGVRLRRRRRRRRGEIASGKLMTPIRKKKGWTSNRKARRMKNGNSDMGKERTGGWGLARVWLVYADLKLRQ